MTERLDKGEGRTDSYRENTEMKIVRVDPLSEGKGRTF